MSGEHIPEEVASKSVGSGEGSACRHECTRGREGQTGSWCDKCGLKIYEVDPRECQHCAHFKDVGFPCGPRSICTKHLMGITRDMHVTYEIAKGTCFSPNTSSQRTRPPMPDHQPTEATTQEQQPGSL